MVRQLNELRKQNKKLCFLKKKAQRIMRFLILDTSAPKAWKSLPSLFYRELICGWKAWTYKLN